MTDIVERLRSGIGAQWSDDAAMARLHREAADEIERLREALIRERHGWQAEVERLRREVMRAGGAGNV